jgi:D-3-phosphoglycerate dehydrogenase
MKKVKKAVIISDKINNAGVLLLKNHFTVLGKYGLSNDKLIDYILSCRRNPAALIVRSTRTIDKKFIKVLSELKSIKVLCTVSTGFDNIDIEACKLYKIKVLNVPLGNYASAAEHTMAMILSIYKQINQVHAAMKKRKFITGYNISKDLSGKTIGVIGVGRIGSYVARLSKAFGMTVYGNDIKKSLPAKYKWIKFTSLNQLLKTCDIVTVHTPLDKSTRDLINKNNLRLMKKDSVLINCARGGIVNEQALFKSLKNKKILFAGLDVYKNEPDIDFSFSMLDNVLLTPHIAGKTKESHKRMSVQAARQIINYYK